MKKIGKFMVCVGFLVLTLLAVHRAEAITTLTTNSFDPYLLGYIIPPQPASNENELGWLTQLVGMTLSTTQASTNPAGHTLTRTGNDFGLLSVSSLLYRDNADAADVPGDNGALLNPLDATGIDFILGKYANEVSFVWYVGGLSPSDAAMVSLPSQIVVAAPTQGDPNRTQNQGLSHITFFGMDVPQVPDAGSTFALMGLSALAVGAMRKRNSK